MMAAADRKITRADIMDMAAFGAARKARRAALLPAKKLRRIEVGPHATFYFENYETMWLQVHEMLFIEKGGEDQIADELSAYNPLIPQGSELVATMMIEVEDPVRRARALAQMGHIEDTIFLDIGGERIKGELADDAERTTPEGKTSAVHFFRFPLTAAQIAKFKDVKVPVMLGADHPNYAHLAALQPAQRAEMAKDFG